MAPDSWQQWHDDPWRDWPTTETQTSWKSEWSDPYSHDRGSWRAGNNHGSAREEDFSGWGRGESGNAWARQGNERWDDWHDSGTWSWDRSSAWTSSRGSHWQEWSSNESGQKYVDSASPSASSMDPGLRAALTDAGLQGLEDRLMDAGVRRLEDASFMEEKDLLSGPPAGPGMNLVQCRRFLSMVRNMRSAGNDVLAELKREDATSSAASKPGKLSNGKVESCDGGNGETVGVQAKLKAVLTVTFNIVQKLGWKIDRTTGRVTEVEAEGQAHHKNVQTGMFVKTIDGQPYSASLFREKVVGKKDYQVTLAIQRKKPVVAANEKNVTIQDAALRVADKKANRSSRQARRLKHAPSSERVKASPAPLEIELEAALRSNEARIAMSKQDKGDSTCAARGTKRRSARSLEKKIARKNTKSVDRESTTKVAAGVDADARAATIDASSRNVTESAGKAPLRANPAHWPQNAFIDTEAWISWLPVGWDCGYKITCNNKYLRCFVGPPPEAKMYYHKNAIEKYLGRKLDDKERGPKPSKERIFDPAFEEEFGPPNAVVRSCLQSPADGYIEKRCQACDGLTLEELLTRFTFYDESRQVVRHYSVSDLKYDLGRATRSSKRLRVEKPEPSQSKPSFHMVHPRLSVGARVQLHGLLKSPKMNRLGGRLLSYDGNTGRWQVCLLNRQVVNVRPENLRVKAVPVES